ncbi:hypothetical protein RHMOL_Rhmol07G0034700 [Rhododendron molle]|uniref:Uncharacterized protein n=1 Tax=Rhododendron molle TaxID=49168 RepID=A0ACC0MXY3_RHOML|nr:hypothetical protein RHMOL_Rhmol07G0034700 [Rhododendron molle]
MPEIDGSSQPQITEMFSKFALAFKTKTFEFFAEDDDAPTTTPATPLHPSAADIDPDNYTLLVLDDSAEEFITDQKVVVIKPDAQRQTHIDPTRPAKTHVPDSLIPSLFATVSSFEASYLHLQTAHVPYHEDTIRTTDKTLVSHLQKLSEIKRWYTNYLSTPNPNPDFPIGSCSEAQVQENQSKLRCLETVFNRLQTEIDEKGDRVFFLRQELDKIRKGNGKLSKKLSSYSGPSSREVALTVRVFDSMLREACRSMHGFSKLLIGLMKEAKWDLDLAASSVHSGVDYAKRGHNRYAFLSYASLCMFRGFDSEGFGLLDVNGIVCNGMGSNPGERTPLGKLNEHVSCNPMEVLSKNPNCGFSRFCELKYQELIHPTMESSIFVDSDRNEAVLNSWKSLSVFYESFVKMASSIWLLHKLAYSFDPVVEIFQVERGVDFSMVYMEDVTRKGSFSGKSRPKVGFTVIPGFKVGRTVLQSQVYLIGSSVHSSNGRLD